MARILVAEDNLTNLDLITTLLKAFGHETLEAHDGRQALEVARRERPDLILMDIHMPVMDGYEAVCELRKESALKSTTVIAITALAMVGDKDKILHGGFDGYISKPIDPETFVQELDPYLVKLPGAAPRRAAPQMAETEKKSAAPGAAPSPSKGLAILVVDNLPVNVDVLRSLLEPSGYQVVSATGAEEGLAKLRTRKTDLIMSDVHMPGLSGYDFIRAVKAESGLKDIPFMFISSTSLSHNEFDLAIQLGANKFVTRPIEPPQLLREIEDLLGWRGKGQMKATILVADDRAINRELMVTLLGYRGHKVLQAKDGMEALKLAQASHPDLIITDIIMPKMDGYDFAKKVRADLTLSRTPIIFYTATFLAEQAHALAKSAGVKYVLPKPSEPETILRVIDTALGVLPAADSSTLPQTIKQKIKQSETDQLARELLGKSKEVEATTFRMASMIELGMALTSEPDPMRLGQVFTDAARRIIGARWVAVSMSGADRSRAEESHWSSGAHEYSIPRRLYSDLVDEIIRSGEPRRLAAFDISEARPGQAVAMAAVLAVPITEGGSVHGCACLFEKLGAVEFDDVDEQVALTISAMMATAYENKRLNEEVQRRAAELQIEITQRHNTEAENLRLVTAIEQAAEATVITDPTGAILYVNPAFTRITGYSSADVLNRNMRILKSGVQGQEFYRDLWDTIKNGRIWQGEIINRRKDGSLYPEWMTITPVRDADGKLVNYISIKQDISDRKKAEQELTNLNRVYAVISQINQLIVRTRDANTLFAEACRIAVEYGKFRMAWIGMVDEKERKLKPASWAGAEDGYLSAIPKISVDSVPEGLGPAGAAIREGKSVICNDYENDPRIAPWREEALKRGYQSAIALPIIVHGNPIGAFVLYAPDPFFFNDAEKQLLEEVTGDISFALEVMVREKQHKLAQDALHERDALLKESQRAGRIGTWAWNMKTNEEIWSDEMYRLFSLEPGSARPSHEWSLSLVHPEDRQRLTLPEAKQPGEKQIIEKEYRVIRADGAVRHFQSRGEVVYDSAGNAVQMFGTTQDVTERKQAEEAVRRLSEQLNLSLDSANMGTWDWNIKENKIEWGPRQHALFGLKPGTFGGTLKDFMGYVHQDDREQLDKGISESIDKGGDFENEFRILWPDGSEHAIAARGAVRHNKAGVAERMTGVCWDVSEHRQLEQQFRQSQKMEAVGQLAGGVAHDFNNILTVINGYSELMLLRRKSDDPDLKYLEEIKKAGDRAAALTRQLLAFSRRQVLMPQVVDLNSVISNMDKMVRRLIGEDVDLVSIQGRDLGRVKADPGQMEQVILNLAVNARDAMPQGGKLTIETANVELDEAYASKHVTAKPGPHVMLAVSDTGIGMDAKTQKLIFEPFFTTKEKGKGTGLGLSTVYGIVKQSEGQIWVYSEPGHGTTFKVYLPRVDMPAELTVPEPGISGLLHGTETILLVEDEPSVRALVQTSLESGGYTVLTTTNGIEALILAGQHEGIIDLMVTDLVMPEMGGRSLAEQMATMRPETKVIYMSGYTDDAVVRHGGLGPGMAFLQKPFTPDSLLRKVREVLGAR